MTSKTTCRLSSMCMVTCPLSTYHPPIYLPKSRYQCNSDNQIIPFLSFTLLLNTLLYADQISTTPKNMNHRIHSAANHTLPARTTSIMAYQIRDVCTTIYLTTLPSHHSIFQGEARYRKTTILSYIISLLLSYQDSPKSLAVVIRIREIII